MTAKPYDVVVLGLSLSSSWGNGHATTYRSLLAGLRRLGLDVLFLERDVPWYAENRDLARPAFCELAFYQSLAELKARFANTISEARAVVVGSFVPDGISVLDFVFTAARGAVAFYDIDTPVTLSKLARRTGEYLANRHIPKFDVYFSFTGGPTLERLEREFGARRAVALYCSASEDHHRPTNEPTMWDLGYLGTYSPDRQPALDRLLLEPARRRPKIGFAVAGAQYPSDTAWPKNVERIEHLTPGEHASFYSRQRFTLNVTRADMVGCGWSPSVRLFEAAACGTPVISDPWPGLCELFPENEAVLIARSTEDVIAMLTDIDDAHRNRIAASARERVLSSHTGLARAREFMCALSTTFDKEPLALAV
jgi:spore maturation protein CgeB